MTLPALTKDWPKEAEEELHHLSGTLLNDLGVSSFTMAQVKAADRQAEALVRAWWATARLGR